MGMEADFRDLNLYTFPLPPSFCMLLIGAMDVSGGTNLEILLLKFFWSTKIFLIPLLIHGDGG